MFLLSKPDRAMVDRFIDDRRDQGFSYTEIGATRFDKPPRGYNIDRNRVTLGSGGRMFERAKEAIKAWKMFSFYWVDLFYPQTPVSAGKTVAVLVDHFGFHSLNAARIVYVIDEPDRYGFAYGTLADHGEIGEERFSVDFNIDSGEVCYDIFAFSRPGALLAKLGYPLSRYLQKSFARDSMAAMLTAVADADAVVE